MFYLLIFIISSGQTPLMSQNKKSTSYYRRYNRYQKRVQMPLDAFIENKGWNKYLNKTKASKAFTQRNILRAKLLYSPEKVKLSSVLKTFKMDPENSEGRFFLQLFVFLKNKNIKIPDSDSSLPDLKREQFIAFLKEYDRKNYLDIAKNVTTLSITPKKMFFFMIDIATKLKDNGFLIKSYRLFRKALRYYEISGYDKYFTSIYTRNYLFQYIILSIVEILHKRGEYRKAFGVLKWYTQEKVSSLLMKRVGCTYSEIFSGRCIIKKSYSKNLIPEPKGEAKAYRDALIKWKNSWKSGDRVFTQFLKLYPRSPWVRSITRFKLYLKSNQNL